MVIIIDFYEMQQFYSSRNKKWWFYINYIRCGSAANWYYQKFYFNLSSFKGSSCPNWCLILSSSFLISYYWNVFGYLIEIDDFPNILQLLKSHNHNLEINPQFLLILLFMIDISFWSNFSLFINEHCRSFIKNTFCYQLNPY